jgi:hypothetical protein
MFDFRKLLLVASLVVCSDLAVAQEDVGHKEDLGGVAAFIIRKDWNEKWYSFIYCQYEQRDMFKNTELYYARLVGRYKIKPWLHVGLSYASLPVQLCESGVCSRQKQDPSVCIRCACKYILQFK